MDKKNIYDVGSDIMEAVNEAVGSGDFSKLNASLRDVTGSAAGAAADALHDLQGHIQGGGSSAAGGSAAGTGPLPGVPCTRSANSSKPPLRIRNIRS